MRRRLCLQPCKHVDSQKIYPLGHPCLSPTYVDETDGITGIVMMNGSAQPQLRAGKDRPKAERILAHTPSISIISEESLIRYEGVEGWYDIIGLNHTVLLDIFMRFCIGLNFGIAWMFLASGHMETHEIKYAFGPEYVKLTASIKIVIFLMIFGVTAAMVWGVCTRKRRYFYVYCALQLITFVLLCGTFVATDDVQKHDKAVSYHLLNTRKLERNELPDDVMKRFRNLQRVFSCCGSLDYQDYKLDEYPPTCCFKNDNGSSCLRTHHRSFYLNRVGCSGPILDYIKAMLCGGHGHTKFGVFCIVWCTIFYSLYVWESCHLNYRNDMQKAIFQAKLETKCMEEPRVTKSEMKSPDLLMNRYATFIHERETEIMNVEMYPGGPYGRMRFTRIIDYTESFLRNWPWILTRRRARYFKAMLRVLETVSTLDDFLTLYEIICSYYETITDLELVPYYMAGLDPHILVDEENDK